MATDSERALAYLKGELAGTERSAFETELARSGDLQAELERSRELLDLLEAANEEATVRRVNGDIEEALRRGASDLHVVPEQREVVVLLRVGGMLEERMRLPREMHQATVDRWKVMAGMDLRERRLPQDGRVAASVGGKAYEFRVNIAPTVNGERVTARVFDKSTMLLGLDRLGLSNSQRTTLESLMGQPNGLIATAGSVGMGKTTLLYSLLQHLQAEGQPRRNILTAEDPVEYAIDGISQMPIDMRRGLTWSAALKSIMRSDPDIAMVGEVRDVEAAERCIELALTGHLVLTALHVPSALLIPRRWTEAGIALYLVAATAIGLVGQRLLRKICPDCAVPDGAHPSEEMLKPLGLTPADGPFRFGRGCASCRHTGYRGRTGLFEVACVDDEMGRLITRGASFDELWDISFGRNGGSMWHDGRDKVLAGITTVDEVIRVLFDYPRHGI